MIGPVSMPTLDEQADSGELGTIIRSHDRVLGGSRADSRTIFELSVVTIRLFTNHRLHEERWTPERI